jgi:hypothetical protein
VSSYAASIFAGSAFFVKGAGAPAGEGDRIDASTRELLEAARQWAPAEVRLRFPLLLDPVADIIADLELYERAQRRPGVVHVRNVAGKGWCTVHQCSSLAMWWCTVHQYSWEERS